MKKVIVIALLLFSISTPAYCKSGGDFFNILQAPSDVDKTTPTDGQVLAWDSSRKLWVPSIGGGMSIGGAVTSGTPGSALFVDASGNLGQDNSNFFWDNINHRFGIGTTSPGAKLEVDGAASGKGLIVKANATTPGDLQEWQNSSNTIKGLFSLTNFSSLYAGLTLQNDNVPNFRLITNSSASGEGPSVFFGDDTNKERWQYFMLADAKAFSLINRITDGSSSNFGHALYIDTANRVAIGAAAGGTGYTSLSLTDQFLVNIRVNTFKGLVIKGAASQSVNLQDWQNNSGTPLSWIDSSGTLHANCVLPNTGTAYFDTATTSYVLFAGGTPQSRFKSVSPGNTPVEIQGATSQSADLLQLTNIGNGVLSSFSATGILTLGLAGTQTGTLKFNGTTSGTVTLTTASAAGTGTLTLPGTTDTVVCKATTDTLTNKRITKRVVTAADATSITPNSDNADITYQANTQSVGTLTINADGGTPTNGQSWILKIKSTNAQTFSWNSIFEGGTVALPTVTTASSKYDYYCFIYDSASVHWEFTGTAGGFA